MKIFSVSDACIACGECLLSTDLLIDNGEGFAIPAPGQYIKDDQQLKAANQLAELCPVQALSIIEKTSVLAKGNAGLLQLAEVLEQRMREVDIPYISYRELAFNPSEYHIEHGYVDEYQSKYSSFNKALNAGKEKFLSVYWNHMKDFVASALSQYKSKVLRKYYDLSDPEHTYYAHIGAIMTGILKDVQGEACSLGFSLQLFPEDFTKFYPEGNQDFQRLAKREYEQYIGSIDFIKQFCESFAREDKSNGRDFQCIGQVVATESGSTKVKSIFGTTFKPTYRMRDVNIAGELMIENLLSGLSCAITEASYENNLEFIMEEYRKLVDKTINEKVNILKQLAADAR